MQRQAVQKDSLIVALTELTKRYKDFDPYFCQLLTL